MNTSTSVAGSLLNETVVRLVAGFVVLLTVLTLSTAWVAIPLYLSVDFFLRAFTDIKPPLALLAKLLAKNLRLKEKPIYAPPKKFAAAIGFFFSVAISVLLLLSLNTIAFAVAGVLLFFAILESVFAICAGCYVYDLLVVPFKNKFK